MVDPAESLRSRRADAEKRVATLTADIEALRADRASDAADDEHDPEGVPLSAEWSRLEGLRDAARTELGDIDAALERLGRADYGVCVDCGLPIPPERLEARPTAIRCVPCQARREG